VRRSVPDFCWMDVCVVRQRKRERGDWEGILPFSVVFLTHFSFLSYWGSAYCVQPTQPEDPALIVSSIIFVIWMSRKCRSRFTVDEKT
jgi:hypothetical protein